MQDQQGLNLFEERKFEKLKFIGRYWYVLVIITTVLTINLFAQDIQEDSWITFRTAFNLADHGQWSFNLGDQYSSTTSFVYPLVVAFFRIVFGEYAIPIVLIFNSILVVVLSYLIVDIFGKFFQLGKRMKIMSFLLISIQPVSLLLAGKGMETVYVILFLSVSIKSIIAGRFHKAILVSSVLIFFRPDAIVYSLILSGYVLIIKPNLRNRIVGFHLFFTYVYFFANKVLTNSWIPASINAKVTSYETSINFRIKNLLTRPQIETFAPISTKFVSDNIYVGIFVLVIMVMTYLLIKLKISGSDSLHFFCMIYLIIVSPVIIYSLASNVFPWYTWPSRFIFQSLCIMLLVRFLARLSVLKYLSIILVVVLTFSQLAISFNTGIRYKYRIEIGKYLKKVSDKSSTLVLEPAGQIPFFSELKTIDTVGLTSAIAIRYQRIYGDTYLGYMLNDIKPGWIILLNPIEEVIPELHSLNNLEDVRLVRHFKYIPSDFSSGFILKIANYGTLGDDLYLYKLY